jgi:protoporphyrinogen IX oxidase
MAELREGSPGRRAGVSLGLTTLALIAVLLTLPPTLYDWVKAFHVISVIAWMAGLLYLPRLFVYHAASTVGSEQSETFKLMEHRLLTVIINPAMIVAWVLGLWLAWEASFFSSGWFHAKIFLVILLSALHGYLSSSVRAFAEDRNTRSERHWRLVNEVPTVLMIGIVVLVIVKPF